LILDRDFFHDDNLTSVYKPIDIKQRDTVELFKEVASTEIIDKPENKLEFNNIKTDFGVEIDKRLVILLKEASNTSVPVVNELFR